MSELTSTFSNIANAIRSKAGVSTGYSPSEMASAIRNLPTGGGDGGVAPFKYKGSSITTYSGDEELILYGAFQDCSSLTTVSFPECTYIDQYAFYGCSSLSAISFPSCSYIDDIAFEKCINLESASFPECCPPGHPRRISNTWPHPSPHQ